MRVLRIQAVVEFRTLARNPEQLLLVLVIPAALLLFFAKVDVVSGVTLDGLVPGILGLAVMSTTMVGLGISAGFERSYGVLKRLAMTPLGTRRLVLAKTIAVGMVLVVQFVLLGALGVSLGWRPEWTRAPLALAAVALAALAFAGIGLTFAGRLRAESNLAALNALYVLLLLASGFVLPMESLPAFIGFVATSTPAPHLVDALRGSFGAAATGVTSWLVLVAWAIGAPLLAAWLFRWE